MPAVTTGGIFSDEGEVGGKPGTVVTTGSGGLLLSHVPDFDVFYFPQPNCH